MSRLGRLARRLLHRPRHGSAPIPTPTPLGPAREGALDNATLVDLSALQRALVPRDLPLLVNHWATWCEGCVSELPLIVDLHGRWSGQLDFLGISWDRFMPEGTPLSTLRQVQVLCTRYGVGWQNLVYTGEPSELFEGLGLESRTIPQTFLLLPDGDVAWAHDGVVEAGDMEGLEKVLVRHLSV